MLLFVRNPYWRDIVIGAKRFELRAGARYSHLRVGDKLSINGKLRALVTRVQQYDTALSAAQATSRAGYFISPLQIQDCYPDLRGPFYLIHFQKADGPAPNAAA